tara:strand:+ start:371 stop:1027 length:657 start_codon:yes stop_codon:yes gene_type:complete
MALNKLKFNSLNVTPVASKGIGFNSSANGLEATFEGGSMRFIKKLTASSSSTLSFVDGSSDVVLDNTFKEYVFIYNNIHPETNDVSFVFNLSTDAGSNYNVVKTTTFFRARNKEVSLTQALEYRTTQDLAQGSGTQQLAGSGNDNDQAISGTLTLFNPSSTTFVKHFIATNNATDEGDGSRNNFIAGYANTTSAIDAVQFSFASGNIDAGTITLYGIN